MAQIRKGSFIKSVKDISIGSALAIALLSGITLGSCSSNQEDEQAYSYEETTFTKGIRSHIKEVKPGEFKITSEDNVPPDSSGAIVTYLDGHTDKLSPEAAKALIDEEIRNNQSYVGHHSGLSTMLLYGGMGYLLGRNSSNGYMNSYRNSGPQNPGAFYSNPSAYQKSQSAFRTVDASRTTRTVNTRPSGGRKGFFGRSSSRSGG